MIRFLLLIVIFAIPMLEAVSLSSAHPEAGIESAPTSDPIKQYFSDRGATFLNSVTYPETDGTIGLGAIDSILHIASFDSEGNLVMSKEIPAWMLGEIVEGTIFVNEDNTFDVSVTDENNDEMTFADVPF